MIIKNFKINKSNICTFYIKSTGHNTFISIFKETILIKNNKVKPNQKLIKIFSCGSG